jgi:oxygen-independent coproporphyrinogen-3 oxidase
MSVSLYVHIPFCVKRCIYCDFVSGAYTPENAHVYLEALIKEISGIPADRPLSTLYIGGGTPTVLTPDNLSLLIKHIFNHFDLTDDHEATIEANPGTLYREKLQKLLSSGMNRISIGVQSFNDSELAFLGRIHSPEEAREAVLMAEEAGFENIGIDLIYGIPGQDIVSWKRTLEKAVRLKPQHISTYELTVEKGTELYRLLDQTTSPRRGGNIARLDEDLVIGMYEQAIDFLKAEGYLHYEISNFALPGCLSRHNLNYWDRGDYYGTGTGAHSFTNNKRSRNTADIDRYQKLVSQNMSPVEHSEEITPEKALSEAIFLGLRKTEGINMETFLRRYGKNILTVYGKEIKEMQDAGLIETCSSECSYETDIQLTRKGLLLSNEVFVKFI